MDVFFQNLSVPSHPRIVVIGNFDGVHIGHLQVLQAAKEEAKSFDVPILVLSFDPHPTKVLAPDLAPPLLCTMQERLGQLEKAGVDEVLLQTFDKNFARKTPEQFVKEILMPLKARCVVVGYDFSFGIKRSGNFDTLQNLCKTHEIRTRKVDAFSLGDSIASSTKIRHAIKEGFVKEAAHLLGRPFRLSGKVIKGAARGRTIGFPTANIDPEQETLPKVGVYACQAKLSEEETLYHAVVNIGFAPTFGKNHLKVEAHLLDIKRDLYGKFLELLFIERIRAEKKFSGLEALKTQIALDTNTAKNVLQNFSNTFAPRFKGDSR